MLNLSLNYWQLILIVVISILVSKLVGKLISILLKIIFSSKPMVQWNLKRQYEQQKVVQKTKRQIMYDNLLNLGKFMDWIDKNLGNVDRRHFYRDFARSKETREYWIKTLLDTYAPEEKKDLGIIKTEQPTNKNVSKENKG